MSLAQILTDFENNVLVADSVIAAVHVPGIPGHRAWSHDERAMITEAAFLKVFLAWESFLERSFRYYMTGQPSLAGQMLRCYANPTSEAHADRMLIGTARFVDWSTPDTVRRLADIYFDGGAPFEATIAAIHSDLLDLKTVRNAAAHLSSTTSAALDALATRRLGHPCLGVTVYGLLLSTDPISTGGGTLMSSLEAALRTAAHAISYA